MKNNKVNIPNVLFGIIMILITLPMVQKTFPIFRIKPLKGWVITAEKKELSPKDWFSGEYQEAQEKYLNDNFGFRNIFVRINNQLSYSLFNKLHAVAVVRGKENYLYEENYILTYYGDDYIGRDSIVNRLSKLKKLQDILGEQNKQVILALAPGKGYFYPEFIPEEYHKDIKQTNYQDYSSIAIDSDINLIDFQDYFQNLKGKTYPLMPKYGIHWSKYGAHLALDSIIRYVENIRNIDMPNFYWDEVIMDQPRGDDYDIGNALNLMWNLRSFEMAYPVAQWESDEHKEKPSLLMIADSFGWGIFSLGMDKSFSKVDYWYYNQQAYPADVEVSNFSLSDAISEHDIILILSTDGTSKNLGWGFIEQAYELLVD